MSLRLFHFLLAGAFLLGCGAILHLCGQEKRSSAKTRSQTASPFGSLSIEAGLIYRSGDVKPVARADLFLFDKPPGLILKEAGIKPLVSDAELTEGDDHTDMSNDFVALSLVSDLRLAMESSGVLETSDRWLANAWQALNPHIIGKLTTDFSGKALFSKVPLGVSYLLCFHRDPSSSSTKYHSWNLKIDITKGRTAVVLDNSNMDPF